MFESTTSDSLNESSAASSKLVAGACALLVATLLLGGYFYLRNRHAKQNAATLPPSTSTTSAVTKGPAKLHVLVDEPLLKDGATLIGGTVKNISNEELAGLSVDLELWRRRDGSSEIKTASIEPATLGPNEEGRYAIKLPAQEYATVRLSGFRSSDVGLLAYTSAPGQKRPLEKTESKTVIIQRPAGRGEEFINTPDNPGRVP
jgi:hypothetical protein